MYRFHPKDTRIIVTYNGKQIGHFGVVNGEPTLLVNRRDFASLEITDDPDVLVHEAVEMEIIQESSYQVRPIERTPRPGSRYGISALDESDRDQILEEIGKSWAINPDQNKTFTQKETHRIAKEIFGDNSTNNVMRVAGVRAALTRGVYDYDLEDLVKQHS